MAKAIKNIPLAQNLMGSMRSMGYNFESAVADVVIIVSVQDVLMLEFASRLTH